MKALGVISIVAGVFMTLLCTLLLFNYGVVVLSALLTALIAVVCGVICLAVRKVFDRLEALDEQLTRIDDAVRSQDATTADQIVDELRQSGLLREDRVVDQQAIEEFAD